MSGGQPVSSDPILPRPGKRNVLITSALPYVNNVPHLGNIIGSVLSADVFSRYCKGRGINTLYVCGTDEYGTTTEARALVEKCTPQELCDKYYAIHSAVYKWFNIGFDVFGRTTTKPQTVITQAIFLKLQENGFLEERVTTQLYCDQHQSFLADRFVEGACPICGPQNPRCKIDGATPVCKDTKHVFLQLDKLQPEIETFFRDSVAKGSWSRNGVDITAGWLKKGLISRSITRDVKWGTEVPLPGYENKVIYAWFDACIGYVSITANYTDQWELWWRNPEDVQLYQFLGKDNVPFHTVIFPGSQIGTRDTWTKLHHLSTTEYLTYEGGKFSKSRGVGVFGDSAQQTGVPSDVWRYYLLSNRPETSDSEFNWDLFISSNNNLLLKNLGNFVSRVLKFIGAKHYSGVVPDYTAYQSPALDSWKEQVNSLLKQYIQELDAVKLRAGLTTAMNISHQGNSFLQSSGLNNKLAEEHPAKCAAVVGLAVNLIHLIASLVAPYMPDTARSIFEQLRADPMPIRDSWNADSIKPGHEIRSAQYLFTAIKPEKGEEWREMFGSEEAKKVRADEAAKKASKKAARQETRS